MIGGELVHFKVSFDLSEGVEGGNADAFSVCVGVDRRSIGVQGEPIHMCHTSYKDT